MNATRMSSSFSNIGSALTPVATSAGIAAGVVTGVELCYITYKLFQGDIQDWRTYGRLVTRSAATGVGSFAGNCIGYSTGAVIGGSIGMIGGTVGAVAETFVGGILGSIFGCIVGGASAAQAFEKWWPDEE